MTAKLFSDEAADEAIHEILVRFGHRKPTSGDEFRWAAEGPRRVRDLDTLREFLTTGRPQ